MGELRAVAVVQGHRVELDGMSALLRWGGCECSLELLDVGCRCESCAEEAIAERCPVCTGLSEHQRMLRECDEAIAEAVAEKATPQPSTVERPWYDAAG